MSLRVRGPAKRQVESKSITAAAERLADRLAIKTSGSVGEGWQHLALDMYDAVPELRAAARITGQAMSQCRLVIARTSDGSEPAPLDVGLAGDGPDADHPAQQLLDALAGGQGGQSAWLDMVGVHLTVTGESISVGALDPRQQSDSPVANWTAYSPEQVKAQNKIISVKVDDSARGDVAVNEEEDGVTAVRIWRPHPRYNWQADSAARAALGAMQEILLYDQHIESTAISRLVSAGLLAVPDGMTLPGLPAEDDGDTNQVDPFMRFLMTVMSTAIKDRASAAARVPIMVRGDKEDIAAIRHITFDNQFDDQIIGLRDAAVNRLAVAVDMPATLLKGLGDTQHWSGALITQDWVNNYLQALMSLVCGSLTTGWLKPALKEVYGASADMDDIIVWFDSSSVRVRENIGPETQWAWENGLVSDDTARRVLGFDDSDALSEEEATRSMLLRMLYKSPDLAPLIFPLLGIKFTPEQLNEAKIIAEAIRADITTSQPSGPSGPTTPPRKAIPTEAAARQPTSTTRTSPASVSASAAPDAPLRAVPAAGARR